MTRALADYKKAAKILIEKHSGMTINKNDLAVLCGLKSAREVKNFSQMKSIISGHMEKQSYFLDTVKGIGYRVRKLEEGEKAYKSYQDKEKSKNAAAFDAMTRASSTGSFEFGHPHKPKVVDNNERVVEDAIVFTKPTDDEKAEQLIEEANIPSEVKVTKICEHIEAGPSKQVTIADLMRVLQEDPKLEVEMNKILKPLGKEIEYIPKIVDIPKEVD